MISPTEREFAIKQLDQTRERLLSTLQGLSREQLLFRPEPERWSVAEHVEHLIEAEKLRVDAIDKLIQEPPDFSTQSAVGDEELIKQIVTITERLPAPSHLVPKSQWPVEELLREFATTRERTRDFMNTTEGDLRHHFIRHFYFGDLDCYQWLLLIGAHCTRHRTHCEAVKAAPGFPH